MKLITVQTIKDFERNGRIIKAGSEISIMPELMAEYEARGILRLKDGTPYILPPEEVRKAAKELKKKIKGGK